MLQENDPWAVIEGEVQSFRAGTVRFLEILIHFDREKLYAEKGYSSLFALLTERYGFSEGQALRRINCCRAAQVYPACLDHLANGTISVCALATIQQVMTAENAEALIKKVKGQSTKQVSALVEALKSVAQHSEPLPLFAPRPASTLDDTTSEPIDDTKTAKLVAPSTLTVESCGGTNLTPSPQPSDPKLNTAAIIAPSTLKVTPPTKKPLPTSEQIEALTPETVAEPAKIVRFTGGNLHLYRQAEQRFGHLREEHLINRVFTVALRNDKPRTTQTLS